MTNTKRMTNRKWAHFCGVLRMAGGDCTRGGITSKVTNIFVIGPDGAPDGWKPRPGEVYLEVEERNIGGWVYTARIPVEAGGKWGAMAGGNFVTTSDSRWTEIWGTYNFCLSVHDRYED